MPLASAKTGRLLPVRIPPQAEKNEQQHSCPFSSYLFNLCVQFVVSENDSIRFSIPFCAVLVFCPIFNFPNFTFSLCSQFHCHTKLLLSGYLFRQTVATKILSTESQALSMYFCCLHQQLFGFYGNPITILHNQLGNLAKTIALKCSRVNKLAKVTLR